MRWTTEIRQLQDELHHLRICLSLAEERHLDEVDELAELRYGISSIEGRLDRLRATARA